MFSLFKKDTSPALPYRDKIWITGDEARKGLLMMAMMRLQQQQPALIFTFFEEEKQQLSSFMDENKISYKILDTSIGGEELIVPCIYLAETEVIQTIDVANWLNKNTDRFGKVVFFQCHYPIIAVEDKVLIHFHELGFLDFIFCLSFDDPMMTSFKKNIVTLMKQLGLEENESIEHSMVTTSIKNVRKKIDGKVKVEKKARSAAEWYALNVKS